jgi:predicted membrane-bound mannosyltransferase
MPHFKDPSGVLHFLEDAQFISLLPVGSVQLTPEEEVLLADSLAAPVGPEQLALQQKAMLTSAIQAYVDAPAKAWGYDDAKSAVTYVGDPYAPFNAEGVAIQNFRSDCWALARMVEQAVMVGERAMPTLEELLALMPEPPDRPVVAGS